MNVLIVGSEKKWAIENFYFKYLQKHGVNVTSFPAHDIFDDFYHASIFNKLWVRSKLSGIYKKINKQLLNLCSQNNYDIIWVFKGMELFPATLKELSKKGIKLVNYNPDHPFVHTFRGSGNAYVRNSIPHYHAHFCYSIPVLKKIQALFNIPCTWLPFAYEPSSFKFPTKEAEIIKACFIGNPDPFRASVINELHQMGVAIDVYGNKWERFIKISDTLKAFPAIYKQDFSKVAPIYRLHLNIFRPHNDNSHNMRTFEMPSLGCIVLAPDSEEHRLLFKQNKEIFLYTSIAEMFDKTRKVLNLSYEEALMLRQASYSRVISSGYTYEARALEVKKWFEKIVNNSLQLTN